MRRLILGVALVAAGPRGLTAQLTAPAVTTESGVYGEAYRVSGRDARRPEQTLRAYLSPTFSWMGLTIGANFLFSTENQFTAQTLNRLYVNPRWGWGQVHAGDYLPTLSRFTAQAVRVRGGGFELQPGRFRFAATGSRVSQAGDLSVFDAATTRTFYGGLVGYGNREGTFVELSAARAIDDTLGTDSVSVAPQENLVGALAAGAAIGIPDGATMQMGIGAIPDAVLNYLENKKDLGIHSEMFSDGVVRLVEMGVINNSRKTIHNGKIVVGFILGTQKLSKDVYEVVSKSLA